MGIRTPGLFIANEALYQLSYTPGKLPDIVAAWRSISTRRNRCSEKPAEDAWRRQKRTECRFEPPYGSSAL